MTNPAPFLRRLALRNFKSIAVCDVELAALTVVVGRNGAGKSNLLDSLHFVVDALHGSLDHAVRTRGGIDAVRRRSTGQPRNFAVRLDFTIDEASDASYAFEISAKSNGYFAVKQEVLTVRRGGLTEGRYHREEAGLVDSAILDVRSPVMPPVLEDRLYLVNAAGLPPFRPAYDALLAMGFYNLNPEAMKEVQSPDAGDLLHSDGSNVASVISRLSTSQPGNMRRIEEYLSTIVPGIAAVERVSLGPKETLMFGQNVEGAQHPWRFYASSMSDGTLRTLGALVAVTQIAGERNVRLVGIEEPETALHPAASGALMDALREASTRTQVIITTHSADLLDQVDPQRDALLVVAARNGTSHVSSVDVASRDAIESHLYTPGEMLRMDQLQPDFADIDRQEQLNLFEFAHSS